MIAKYPKFTQIFLAILDTMVIIVSFILASYLRNWALKYYPFGSVVDWHDHWNMLFVIVLVWLGLFSYQEIYSGQRFASLKNDILAVIKTLFWGTLTVLTFAFLIKSKLPRTLIVIFSMTNLVLFIEVKIHLHQVLRYLIKRHETYSKVLVVGTGDVAKAFIDSVRKYPDWGIKIIGLISKEERDLGKERFGYKIVGYADGLREVLHLNPIDELIIALPAKWLGTADEVMNICDEEGIQVCIVSPFFKNLISKAKVDMIHDLPIIKFSSVERDDFEIATKRAMDIFVSFVLLVLLSPVFLIIGILIKAGSKGPIFYRWEVLGLNKQNLTSYKFRTMVENADELKEELEAKNEMIGAAFKMKNDPRITSVGRWLRKYSLDELPQLWSVFKGDLSLVGPRPPLQTEIEKFSGWHRRKLSVKPGITCLWQVNGRNDIDDFDEWMRLDMRYIDNWSLWLDTKILFKTAWVVLRGTGR